MKHLILATLLSTFSMLTSFGQRPWVPKGTQWQLVNHQSSPWLPQPYYAICTDTVLVDGIWCSEISPYLNCAPMSIKKQYLYEQDRRVYFAFQGAFHQIFDYTKAAGESYTAYFVNNDEALDSALVSIDSVFVTTGPCPTQVQIPVEQPISGTLSYSYDYWIIEGQGYFPTIFPEYQGCDPVTAAVQCYYAPGTCYDAPCIVPVHEPEWQNNGLLVFPNPGNAFLQFTEPCTGHLTITDLPGKVVHQSQLIDQHTLSLSHLPCGMYQIQLVQQDQSIRHAKWIKLNH